MKNHNSQLAIINSQFRKLKINSNLLLLASHFLLSKNYFPHKDTINCEKKLHIHLIFS